QENDVKALEYLLKSLALQDKSKPKDQAMYNATLIKLGQVHARAKKYDKAFEYFNKAYTGADKLHDYGSKASYALIMSSAYRKKGDMAKAVLYFDKAVAASNLIVNDDFTKVQVIIYLAGTQFDNGNYELALEYSKKAFALAKQLPVNYFVNVTMGNVGAAMVNLAKGKHGKEKTALLTEGIAYIEKATVVTGNMLSLDDMQLYSKYLYEAYEMQGNTAKAYKSYRNYIVYRDSVENKTKRDEFTNRQFEYEYGQKETTLKAKQKLALEQEQANRNYAFAGVGVLLLIAGGAGVAYSRKRKDNRIIAAEKKRSDDLLLNILPAEVAEELKAKGEASAQYYDQVSILFT
ncbi:MAG: tetratricopeptide repeat protein, partial [Sphingobacteriales bacterium]